MRKFLYFYLAFIFLFTCKSEEEISTPEILAAKGYMDLSQWSIEKEPSIELKGEWEFYPYQLINYGEFSNTNENYHQVPLIWNGFLPNKEESNGVGFGTMRLRFFGLPKQELMLYISSIPTSHAIYCGPDLITNSGKVANNKLDSVPNLSNSIGTIQTKCSNYNEFIWHISNFHEFKGGPWIAPVIGRPHRILIDYSNRLVQDLFFLGVTAIMCVYHLVLWIFRKQDRRSLVFSIVCFLFLVRIIGTGKTFEFYYPDLGLYELMNKLEYIGFIGLEISFPWLCRILFPLEINKKFIWANTFIGGIFFVQIILFPSLVYTSYLRYLQIVSLVAIAFVSYGLFKAVYKDRPGARIMGIGYLFVIVTILHDLFISHRLVYGIHIAPIGFFVFLVSQSTILAKIFSNAFKTAEHLSKNLQSEVEAKTLALQIEDEQKTAFFANISHELRTPLTLILGPIESSVMSKTMLNEKQLNVVYNNSKKLLSLVNQLLDLQKIAAGKFQLQLKSLDLAKFTEEILQDFSLLFEKKKIKFEFKNKLENTVVLADPTQIEKCITNYLSNAIKFTPDNGRIEISLNQSDLNTHLAFSIKDNGKGISEDKKQFLFKRFGYSESVLTKEQEGTGLGLSLVREIIELHKGEVGFDSTKGLGSEFWFTLPFSHLIATPYNLLQKSNISLTNQEVIPISQNQNNIKLGGRILVIDDNADLRDFICSILLSNGYTTYQAIDGEDGLDKIRSIKPDLILSDLMMPKISGSNLIRIFKKDNLTKTIPVILLTAKAEVETRKDVRLAGADAYLSKPFNEEELLAVVRNLIQLKQKEKYFIREMEKAQKIQNALLPKTRLVFPEFEFDFYLRSQEKIGGDFYDYISINPRKIRFLIADVSGHGLPSALISSTLKILFQKSKSQSIDEFLESANHDLFGNLAGHFITAQVIEIDLDSKNLTMGNAGHPGLYRIREKSADILEVKGNALGIWAKSKYTMKSFDLEKGDRLIMVTDGIIEVLGKNHYLKGEQDIKNIFFHYYQEKISDAIPKIIDELLSSAQEKEFEDDATMILIDWKS